LKVFAQRLLLDADANSKAERNARTASAAFVSTWIE
jgi:hypothetical protein